RGVRPLGSPVVAIAAAGAVAVASLRCRPLAAGYPVAVILALVVTATTRNLVPRARPVDGPLAGMTDSFPSQQTALATLLAGLLPLGAAALLSSRRPIWPLRIILGIGVVAGAFNQVVSLEHNPSDVIAGALIGVSLVVAVEWVIDHTGWHQWCRGCVWAPESEGPPLLGVIDLHTSSQRLIRVVAHLWAAASVVMLTVLTVVYGVPTDPGEGAIFGPHIQQPVQLALAVLASIGAVLSWKWDALGAVILAVAGAALAVFSAIEYPPLVAVGLALMFVVPAVLLWLGWQHRRTMAEIIGLATGTAVLLGATFLGVVAVHNFYFGPTHPDSDAVFLEVDEVTWAWVGGVLDDRAVVTAGFDDEPDGSVALVATPVDGGPSMTVGGITTTELAARFELTALEPDTEYQYVIETEGVADTSRGRGRFRTAPTGPSSFRVAVGACARTDSNGAVFDAIAADDPLFFLQIGDIHYGNIESTDPADYRTAYERLLARPGQAELYRNVPIAHVWDDHDFGPNDSDSTSKGRDAAREAYRDMVPHHELVNGPGGPIQHAFTVGRVRFVLTDTRSEKTDDSMLGDEQVEWLIDEVARSSRTHAVVVWANPVPWIAEAKEGADHWAGYPSERRRIADGFADAGVDNLVMVSGDAHMLALDDGTNSDYSTDGVGGFPVLHAAALDRPGGEKGGPFSHGRFGGSGQYGLLDVRDDGDSVSVTLSGVDWEGEVVVSEEFTFEVD
ncbi:MAG: alkaline phosphatase family protein, partial [Acidimicrobiia bacterium]|nr:alkaline phosphatase family protein [Acidimicrobiia bacterium]